MSKFNSVKEGTRTTNLAGGKAYKASYKLALVSLLATSLLTDKVYETEADIIKKFENYYSKSFSASAEGREFFMKALLYTRENFNLRSVVSLGSSFIAESIVKNEITDAEKPKIRRFFTKAIYRGDDVTEMISAYKSRPKAYRKGSKVYLPNVMKRGLSDAIKNFDSYVLGKYKALNKDISMIDALRMTHAAHTEKNNEGINTLMSGETLTANTWEATVSKAGNDEKSKKKAWNAFIDKGEKIEYFALLRNLVNIREYCTLTYIKKACALLTDEKLIAKSKVLPFRFLAAYRYNMMQDALPGLRLVQKALTEAIDISLKNVPAFDGKVCVLLDTSGSMSGRMSSNGVTQVQDVANLFAAALFKANDATVIQYSNNAQTFVGNPMDTTVTIAGQLNKYEHAGTDLRPALKELSKNDYDYVILLSDEQAWNSNMGYWGGPSVPQIWHEYKKTHKNAQLFSFDLAGSGTLEFPENECYCLAGFSDKCLELITKLSADKNYLIKEIESISI